MTGNVIDFNSRDNLEATELDTEFLTHLIMTGNTTYECIDIILKHFNVNEVALKDQFKLYRNKAGQLDVEFEEDGERDSIGLRLFLTLNQLENK